MKSCIRSNEGRGWKCTRPGTHDGRDSLLALSAGARVVFLLIDEWSANAQRRMMQCQWEFCSRVEFLIFPSFFKRGRRLEFDLGLLDAQRGPNPCHAMLKMEKKGVHDVDCRVCLPAMLIHWSQFQHASLLIPGPSPQWTRYVFFIGKSLVDAYILLVCMYASLSNGRAADMAAGGGEPLSVPLR